MKIFVKISFTKKGFQASEKRSVWSWSGIERRLGRYIRCGSNASRSRKEKDLQLFFAFAVRSGTSFCNSSHQHVPCVVTTA